MRSSNVLTKVLALALCSLNLITSFNPVIHPLPSYIQLENVSRKYPVTLMQTLFSSVPKREYAVQNINLSFGYAPDSYYHQNDDGVIILDGRSASGKSTILRLVAGIESPCEGKVMINGHDMRASSSSNSQNVRSWMKVGSFGPSPSQATAHPVIIESKPDFDNSKTVLERIVQLGNDATEYHCKSSLATSANAEKSSSIQQLAIHFANMLTISEEQQSCRPGDLSPSNQFLFGIACCCMVSIAPAVSTAFDIGNDVAEQSISIPCPIILFDELFDAEASSTVDKCRLGILNLIREGGIVVSVTHKPMYFMDMACRRVTLSSGKVLTNKRTT